MNSWMPLICGLVASVWTLAAVVVGIAIGSKLTWQKMQGHEPAIGGELVHMWSGEDPGDVHIVEDQAEEEEADTGWRG